VFILLKMTNNLGFLLKNLVAKNGVGLIGAVFLWIVFLWWV